MGKRDLQSLSVSEICEWMEEKKEKPFRAKQVYEWVHGKLVSDFDDRILLSGSVTADVSDCQ